MKRLLIGLIGFAGAGLLARAQAPQSLAGLTMYAEYSEHNPLGSNTLEVIDFLDDGTFTVRVALKQPVLAVAQPTSPVYTAPFSGTYRYQVSSPTSAVLNVGPLVFPLDLAMVSFSTSDGGVISTTLTPSPDTTSVRFSLVPTGGAPAHRALVNISTLVTAKRGESVAIGFVLGGTAPYREVLIRAVGPSLTPFGVSNPSANPTYNFSRTPRVLDYATGWSANAAAAATISPESARAGAFSLTKGSKDKAEIFLLPPGAYTITVAASTSDQEGAELIEVYEIP